MILTEVPDCCLLVIRGTMSMTEGTTLTSNRASSSDICVFVYVQLLLFRIVPEMSERDFFICQPGSPVATSLCEGEALPKMVAVLTIR